MIRATSKPLRVLPKDQGRCPWCGVVREVKPRRHTSVCMDCRSVLTADERKAWAA